MLSNSGFAVVNWYDFILWYTFLFFSQGCIPSFRSVLVPSKCILFPLRKKGFQIYNGSSGSPSCREAEPGFGSCCPVSQHRLTCLQSGCRRGRQRCLCSFTFRVRRSMFILCHWELRGHCCSIVPQDITDIFPVFWSLLIISILTESWEFNFQIELPHSEILFFNCRVNFRRYF